MYPRNKINKDQRQGKRQTEIKYGELQKCRLCPLTKRICYSSEKPTTITSIGLNFSETMPQKIEN